MKKAWNLLIFAMCALGAHGEKPIRGRFFSQPIFQRQEAAPYPPSGWKPSGQQLILPARQQAPVPHTVYGPPSTEAPTNEYGPPQEPQQPDTQETLEPANGNEYGPPQQPQQPQQPEPQEPENAYGPPEAQNGGYNYAPPETPFPDPENGAGEQPTNSYGPPPEANGQIPVGQGASERLRQQQFFQQLPRLQPTRFVKPARLQQPRRQAQRKPQPNAQFTQKQQLYQASAKPNDIGPNIAVATATAVSGEYYVIEPHGKLQRVSYTTKNGKLVNGKITGGISVDEIQSIEAPIYQVNEFNRLIRIN